MAGKKKKMAAKARSKLLRKRDVDADGRPISKKKKRRAVVEDDTEAALVGHVGADGRMFLVDEARGVRYAPDRVNGRLVVAGRWRPADGAPAAVVSAPPPAASSAPAAPAPARPRSGPRLSKAERRARKRAGG